jgi:hypothetical protein
MRVGNNDGSWHRAFTDLVDSRVGPLRLPAGQKSRYDPKLVKGILIRRNCGTLPESARLLRKISGLHYSSENYASLV